MMIPENIKSTLCVLQDKLHGIPWMVVASTNLALQDIPLQPNDVDVLTTQEGMTRIRERLQKYTIKPTRYTRTGSTGSYLDAYTIDDTSVEVMAHKEICIDSVWQERPFFPKTHYITYQGRALPLCPLEEELAAYQRLGREKDKEKIEQIKIRLQKSI
ncbi:MAG: hypothetical protein V1725_01155 [archaeon]